MEVNVVDGAFSASVIIDETDGARDSIMVMVGRHARD